MGVVPRSSLPGEDLLEVLRCALDAGGDLLTAGERAVVRRIEALSPEGLELYARLDVRVAGGLRGGGARGPSAAVFRVRALRYAAEVVGAVGELVESGLAHVNLPDAACLSAFDCDALRGACRRLGLRAHGARVALEDRLRPHRWVDEPVVAPAHAALLRRLELLCFGRAHVDRGLLVAERIGHVRWARYTPTGGGGLFATRADLRAYERARTGDWLDAGEPLRLLRAGPGDGRFALSPWRYAVEAVFARDPDADTLGEAVRAGVRARPAWARSLLAEGRAAEAHAICARGSEDAAEALALARVARAASRAVGRGV